MVNLSSFTVKMQNGIVQKIADDLLDQYGDVNTQLNILLDKLSQYMAAATNKSNILDRNVTELSKKADNLGVSEIDIQKRLEILQRSLSNSNIPTDIGIDSVQNNTDSVQDILLDVERIEDELRQWNDLIDKYSQTNLSNQIMNIPHSTSEDLSFLEKSIFEDEDLNCDNQMNDDLKSLFKDLATLLNFTGLLDEVLELNKVAAKNNVAAADEFEFVKNLIEKEKETKGIKALANHLKNLMEELQEVLSDMNIITLSEIEPLIQQTEKNIEDYLKEIICYSDFIQNCHIKQPSDSIVLPACMKNCKGLLPTE